MKILMIGGTGFISSHIVRKLLNDNHELTCFVRGFSNNPFRKYPDIEFLFGDRCDPNKLKQSIGNRTFDIIYDMVAYEAEDSRNAIKIFQGKTGRFIHCSTVSVYMISWDVQCPITEDQDHGKVMEFWPGNPFGMDYGIKKRECENVLWDAHHNTKFPVTMLRPTYVSGPADPAKRDFFWIERIMDRGPLLIPGSGDYAFQNVYVEDVAQAFVDLIRFPVSVGQAYNIASNEIFSLNDYINMLCALLNKNPEIVHVDFNVFDKLPFSSNQKGDVFPYNTRRTAIFSIEKAQRHLHFKSTPILNWMTKTIEWFTSNYRGNSNGYENRYQEVEFIKKWNNYTNQIKKNF